MFFDGHHIAQFVKSINSKVYDVIEVDNKKLVVKINVGRKRNMNILCLNI